MNDRDDTYYIDLVRNGDTAAYSYIVERYSGMVYSLSLKLLRNETDAEDLAQEIFLIVFKSLSKFKGSSKFSTWLYRIAYNKAVSRLRKTNRLAFTESEFFLEFHGENDTQEMELSDEEENIQSMQMAIGELNQAEQVLIMLYYYEDQSVEDIAKITAQSASNVKVKLFRIRKKLKSTIESRNSELNPVFH
ncbi:MAG: RNA polymerase sigma factor [Prolixibacteraceae bacterium]